MQGLYIDTHKILFSEIKENLNKWEGFKRLEDIIS